MRQNGRHAAGSFSKLTAGADSDLDNCDLKSTTDFRDVYYELLAQTLRTDSTPSVGAGRRGLGFL